MTLEDAVRRQFQLADQAIPKRRPGGGKGKVGGGEGKGKVGGGEGKGKVGEGKGKDKGKVGSGLSWQDEKIYLSRAQRCVLEEERKARAKGFSRDEWRSDFPTLAGKGKGKGKGKGTGNAGCTRRHNIT